MGAEIGDTRRFLQASKWDPKRKRYRQRNLRDAEDAVAKIAGLWWPRAASGDFKEATKHHHKRALVLTARKSVGLVVGLLHRNEPHRSQGG